MNRKYLSRSVFRILKRSDLIWSLNYHHFLRKELRDNLSKMKLQKMKSRAEVKKEVRECRKYWKCYARDYYLYYELYDKKISIDKILEYVPPYFFANHHQEYYQKGLDIVRLSDKLEQYRLLKSRSVRTPEVVCFIHDGKVCSDDSRSMNLCDLSDYQKRQKIFVKPAGSMGGHGIMVMNSFNELQSRLSELNRSVKYIVQRGIVQREDFSRINPSCVNTLRVIVHEDSEKKRMLMKICILRMGRNNALVDNSAQGGLSIAIDVNNGGFADYATSEHGGGIYEFHPDTDFKFKGNKIEGWESIKDQIEDFASKVVDFRDIALDVAVLDDGVSIIEYNFGYGIDHIQKTIGGIAKVLDVKPLNRKYSIN